MLFNACIAVSLKRIIYNFHEFDEIKYALVFNSSNA